MNLEASQPAHASNDYVIRVVEQLTPAEAAQWDELLDHQATPTPFMRHAYLHAMAASGSATQETGWKPAWVCVMKAGLLVAACPQYVKSHSWGEYVFDWSWARAFRQHGRAYYPKLLTAVPFTPVSGTRLMARSDETRQVLIAALESLATQSGRSSIHVLFADDVDALALRQRGWHVRQTVQFHWRQPPEAPLSSMDAFLATLHRDKRKKILQERKRVHAQGVQFRVLEGDAITSADWDFFYRCHTQTYREHGGEPYLRAEFFAQTARTMPRLWVMFVASQHGEDIATSLIAVDRTAQVAYGRYWGALRHVPMLHFEACYYQPLVWCLAQRMLCFEGGAQGEHKMARGFEPVTTMSGHWLADDDFAHAVGQFTEEEGSAIGAYIDDLQARTPFKNRP
jgi:uncharacterized protein